MVPSSSRWTTRRFRAVWANFPVAMRIEAIRVYGRAMIEAAIQQPCVRPRPGQTPPPGDWTIWAMLAGRGFGKTRAGAEWILELAQANRTRIALIGPSLDAAQSVMVQGESGLLAVAPQSAGLRFNASLRRLHWKNGSQATLYSGGEPDMLRGPQFHFAWGDEAAHWPRGEETLTNLRLGVRLGDAPRILLTTTPKPHGWLKALLAEPGVTTSRGRTRDNPVLPAAFIAAIETRFGGTATGRQELDGELIEDLTGALWTRALIADCRILAVPALTRVVIGVDPPAGDGVCGIIAAGLSGDAAIILADHSVGGVGPNGWARVVVQVAAQWSADKVIVEVNNGGDMVNQVLKTVDLTLPVKSVRASHGKVARAEPVASLYREGRVRHAGPFPALEDQLCGLLESGVYAGPGTSPDRADALVWAVTELLLGARKRKPGVRGF